MENIADVRRALSRMRTAYQTSTPESPLYLSARIDGDYSFSQWSFAFVRMHHQKRQIKNSLSDQRAACETPR
jgi:hypothetical protein